MAYFAGYPAANFGGYGYGSALPAGYAASGYTASGYSYPAYTAAPTVNALPYGYGVPAQYSVPFGAQFGYQAAPTVGFGNAFGVQAAPQSQIKVTYFDMAGRAEAIRLALFLGQIPFEDERLSRDEWAARKESGDVRFGQLPLLEIPGYGLLAESLAQLILVGELANLYPSSIGERAKVHEALFLGEDWVQSLAPSLREQDGERKKALRAKFVEDLPKFVGFIEKLLTETNTGFVAGNRLTIADLSFYVLFEWFTSGTVDDVPVDFLKQSARVSELRDRIHNLPRIQEWRAVQEQRKKDKEAKAAAAAAAAATAAETTQSS
jgi:glutathione S-transferase